MKYKNIFYFKKICAIGGTEQFLYEIAKKYKDYDITVVYDDIDPYQLERLKKLVRCKKHIKGEVIKCDKAFFNFNTEIIDEVEANQYYFIAHAIYQELGYKEPPVANKKLTDFLGVSNYASDRLKNFGKRLGRDLNVITCYNPLTLEPKEKVLHIVGASRLDDTTKGGNRMLKLIEAMDRYCEKTGRHYLFTIFTNTNLHIDSKNVVIMKPRVDVRPFIQDADYVVQLSNDMETYCYTINEALGYGVPIITTPLSILKELPITDNEHLVCDFDMSNADEIVKEIFEKEVKPFNYNPPKDNWEEFLSLSKSTYEEEKKMRYIVEATDKYITNNTWDGELSAEKNMKYYPKKGERWEVSYERKEHLVNLGFVKEVKAIEEVEVAVKEVETEKAIKPKRRTKKQ